MKYARYASTLVVRIDRGEEILSGLRAVCQRENIALAGFSGLGAADSLRCGLYRVEEKRYEENAFEGEFEILSLTGNVTRKGGEVYLHAHVCFADEKGNAFGGHLNFCRVSATSEIFLQVIDGRVGRTEDEETGLNLLDFGV